MSRSQIWDGTQWVSMTGGAGDGGGGTEPDDNYLRLDGANNNPSPNNFLRTVDADLLYLDINTTKFLPTVGGAMTGRITWATEIQSLSWGNASGDSLVADTRDVPDVGGDHLYLRASGNGTMRGITVGDYDNPAIILDRAALITNVPVTINSGGSLAAPSLALVEAGTGFSAVGSPFSTLNVSVDGTKVMGLADDLSTFLADGVARLTLSSTLLQVSVNVDMNGNDFTGSSLVQRLANVTGSPAGDVGTLIMDTGGSVGSGGYLGFKAAQGGDTTFQGMKGYLTDGGNKSRGRLRFFYRAVNTNTTLTQSAQINESGKWDFVQTIGNGTSLRTQKDDIEGAAWLADMVLEPQSFYHKVDGYDQVGFIADDLYAQDERFGMLDTDGDLMNYDMRAVVAILAAKVNRLEDQVSLAQ